MDLCFSCTRAEGRGLITDDPDEPPPVDTSSEAKPVTVRFAKNNDSEAAKKRREATFEYQQKKAEEEAWIPTRFNQLKSSRWEEESQKLFCKRMDDEISSLNQTPKEYLRSLTEVKKEPL